MHKWCLCWHVGTCAWIQKQKHIKIVIFCWWPQGQMEEEKYSWSADKIQPVEISITSRVCLTTTLTFLCHCITLYNVWMGDLHFTLPQNVTTSITITLSHCQHYLTATLCSESEKKWMTLTSAKWKVTQTLFHQNNSHNKHCGVHHTLIQKPPSNILCSSLQTCAL